MHNTRILGITDADPTLDFPIQSILGGAPDSALLTSSEVMQLLLLPGEPMH